MAATLTLSAGVAAYVGSAGVTSSLTISLSGTTYTFADTGEVIDLSGFPGTQTGTGTNTITFSTTNNTVTSITVDLGDGTNTLNLQTAGVPVTFVPSAGTNTFNISSNAPTNSGNLTGVDNVTLTAAGGDTIVWLSSGTASYTVGASTITGMLGPTQNKTFTYTQAGGTISNLRTSSTGASTSLTVDGVSVEYRTNNSGTSRTINWRGNSVATHAANGVSTSTGNDAWIFGTAAGAAAGCDAITANVQNMDAGTGTNSLRIDDTGSATGNKTYTIPGGTNPTVSGFGTGTIKYKTVGGNFNGGYRFDGSSIGGCTFAIGATAWQWATTIVGNGGNTNHLDLTALSGYTSASTGVGTGTVTLSNGKVITYSGIQPPSITSLSPSSGSSAGGTSTVITGTGFLAGATVTIGGASATGVSVDSSTQITCTTPAGTAGAQNVVVANTDGQSDTEVGGFTYTASASGHIHRMLMGVG